MTHTHTHTHTHTGWADPPRAPLAPRLRQLSSKVLLVILKSAFSIHRKTRPIIEKKETYVLLHVLLRAAPPANVLKSALQGDFI
jgi:hypothetical protein